MNGVATAARRHLPHDIFPFSGRSAPPQRPAPARPPRRALPRSAPHLLPRRRRPPAAQELSGHLPAPGIRTKHASPNPVRSHHLLLRPGLESLLGRDRRRALLPRPTDQRSLRPQGRRPARPHLRPDHPRPGPQASQCPRRADPRRPPHSRPSHRPRRRF